MILVEWVWQRWRDGAILGVVDSRMNGEYDESEVMMVLKLGLMCSHCVPAVRPTMRQVVRYFEGEIRMPEDLSGLGNYKAAGKNEGGFDDFIHSYPSPWSEKMSSYYFTVVGDVDVEVPMSTSPLPLISGKGCFERE
uniref:Uncharacterized protein n=1 Tax=Nelumbo nucifera TaxID=4432 RepID=A0A822YA88_NELNU|nr:TPA_asm: hypothetical protein HUJ06_027966 [Nelumbo nucifera]